MPIKLETTSGSITLNAEDGAGDVSITLPRAGLVPTKATIDALGIAATSVTGAQASAITANTAKVTNSTSASDLTSGTLADARFPTTLPAISGANLTNLPSGGGGGGWTEIATQTITSAVSSVVFNNLPTSYDEFRLVITGLNTSSSSRTNRYIGFSSSTTYATDTATNWGYGSSFTEFNSNGLTPDFWWNDKDASDPRWKIFWCMNNGYADPYAGSTDYNRLNGEYFISVKDPDKLTMYGQMNGKWESNKTGVLRAYGWILSNASNPLQSLAFHSNNTANGTFTLYGTTYS